MRKRILAMILTIAIACTLGLTAQAVEYTVTEVVPMGKYDSVKDFSEGLAAVCVGPYNGGKWGFIDKTGKEVISCQYEGVYYDFEDGLAVITNTSWWDDSWVIDQTGKLILRLDPDSDRRLGFHTDDIETYMDRPTNGWISLQDQKTKKFGYADLTGKEVVPCKYDLAWDFSEGLAAVSLNGKWGYIDTTGKEAISCKYDWAWEFSEGLAAVRIGDYDTGKWGFIDKTGQEVVPCKYDEVSRFSEGLVAVWNGDYDTGKQGFVDRTGKEIVPCKYDEVSNFSEGLAAVELDGKWGYIDQTGQEVVPCKYGYAQSFSEGLAVVRIGDYNTGKWGYIDATGKEVISCKYGWANSFSEGLAAVELDGKWGYIDATGREVTPFQYSSASIVRDGVAVVQKDRKCGVIAITAVNTAYQRTQRVEVDGVPVIFPAYALKENGGETNYVKIRDFASIINQMTGMKFDVTWNGALGAVDIVTGKEYKSDGSELATPFSGDRAYETPEIKTLINGEEIALDTFQLKDDAGGGYTYYKLRDLGTALGVHVDWSADRGIYIETK